MIAVESQARFFPVPPHVTVAPPGSTQELPPSISPPALAQRLCKVLSLIGSILWALAELGPATAAATIAMAIQRMSSPLG